MRLVFFLLFIGLVIVMITKGDENDDQNSSGRIKRQAGSCIHPPYDWAKRLACIASCKLQNCATGYCRGRTCVCSRCDHGWGG